MKQRQDSLNRVEILKDTLEGGMRPADISAAGLSSETAETADTMAVVETIPSAKPRLENEYFIIDFDSEGGRITRVELKAYKKAVYDENRKESKVPLLLLDNPKNVWNIEVPVKQGTLHTRNLNFRTEADDQSVTFTAIGTGGEEIRQQYTLTGKPYEIAYNFSVADSTGALPSMGQPAKLTWVNHLGKLERNSTFERSYSTVYYKEHTESVDYCNCRSNDTEDLSSRPIKWFSHSNQFFNSSLIAGEPFNGGVFETVMHGDEDESLKATSAVVGLPLQPGTPSAMTFYIGPNDFENLRSYRIHLEDIIPFGQSIFGSINRWVIRPAFNFLIGLIGSKGIVILVLTLLVKLALFPLSYKMLHSQAKMSALKPQLAGLREKYKDDMQKQQMETMKVYREYGVNPLGGCFPVVLQMPVWFALYRFFPASIEFRQASFLWATDLSSFDVFFYLPFEIPFFGAHVSLLTILWAVSTVAFTFYNMKHMDMSAMNPAIKYMQYFMPIMFLAFFNSYASGLTLYLLYSNLLNIAQTLGAKKFLFDENKIMAELNKNREKPKKKGGFQERLEQAMKEQQRVAEERKKSAGQSQQKKK